MKKPAACNPARKKPKQVKAGDDLDALQLGHTMRGLHYTKQTVTKATEASMETAGILRNIHGLRERNKRLFAAVTKLIVIFEAPVWTLPEPKEVRNVQQILGSQACHNQHYHLRPES